MENRWKQHIDKMRKGTAAELMQAEWNLYSEFSTEILIPCHTDHIDIVEACCIARYNPELNGDRPPCPFPNLTCEELSNLFIWFGMSTMEHVNKLVDLTDRNAVLVQDWEIEHDQVLVLTERRYEEEIRVDVHNKVGKLRELLDNQFSKYEELECKYENARIEIERLRNRSFWQKLFD